MARQRVNLNQTRFGGFFISHEGNQYVAN